ncbi:MAG: zf-HC2 domain-containing protein [Pirellulaceae bacterium]|nr:zf-HC2 domain-containing protein [Pirellulaceae bacterium]
MGSLNEFDRELLSAYLDDALERAERLQVENLLRDSQPAVEYLQALRSNRLDLHNLAKLPPSSASLKKANFAQRVIELAQAAAVEQSGSLQSAAPVAATKVLTNSTEPAQPAKSMQLWAWSALTALAASAIWFVVIPMGGTSNVQPLANLPVDEPVIAQPDTAQQTNDLAQANEPAKAASPGTSNSADMPVGPNGPRPEGTIVANRQQKPEDLHGQAVEASFNVLFMGDVVMTSQGWDAGRFDGLLTDLGIAMASPIVAQPELVKAMIDSQMIVGQSQTDTQASDVAIVFIQSEAGLLEKLMVAIENDTANFRDFSYSLSMGQKELTDALQRVPAGASLSKRGAARLIVLESRDSTLQSILPKFSAVKRSADTERVSTSLTGQSRSSVGMLGQMPAEMLVILRKE